MSVSIQTILQSGTLRGESGYSGTLPSWKLKTSNYTAVNTDRIIADTTGGSFTITLPSTPSIGSYVVITDGGNWKVHNLTIARNGSTIEGYSDDIIVSNANVTLEFIYSGTTWQITITTGASGASGYSGTSGYSGFSGSSGFSGYSGQVGTSGYSGFSGPTSIFKSGSAKTSNYTLSTSDVGYFVEIGTGGSVTIPNSTFNTGDVVCIFNNTATAATVTCSIDIAYISGTDSDKASVSVATRGICTVLFVSPTTCVLTGNVS